MTSSHTRASQPSPQTMRLGDAAQQLLDDALVSLLDEQSRATAARSQLALRGRDDLIDQAVLVLLLTACRTRVQAGDPAAATSPAGHTRPSDVLRYWDDQVTTARNGLDAKIVAAMFAPLGARAVQPAPDRYLR